jgi:hypothetical protein
MFAARQTAKGLRQKLEIGNISGKEEHSLPESWFE